MGPLKLSIRRPLLRCGDDFAFKTFNNGTQDLDCGRGRVVLGNLSEQIRECLEAAGNCARKAAALPDSSPFRQDFLNLEQRWLELARSIEFGESLDTFTKNSAKSNIKPNA